MIFTNTFRSGDNDLAKKTISKAISRKHRELVGGIRLERVYGDGTSITWYYPQCLPFHP